MNSVLISLVVGSLFFGCISPPFSPPLPSPRNRARKKQSSPQHPLRKLRRRTRSFQLLTHFLSRVLSARSAARVASSAATPPSAALVGARAALTVFPFSRPPNRQFNYLSIFHRRNPCMFRGKYLILHPLCEKQYFFPSSSESVRFSPAWGRATTRRCASVSSG